MNKAPFREPALLGVSLVLQMAVALSAPRGWFPQPLLYGLLVGGQLVLVVWAWRHRHRPGMVLVALGVALNALVIGLNGAMPVDPQAIAAAGSPGFDPGPGKHALAHAGTRLSLLADRIPLAPLRTVISVGDVLLAVGLSVLVHRVMRQNQAIGEHAG